MALTHIIAVEAEARFPFQSLDVYVAARELAALVHSARVGDAELRDQATRAAKSVFLNLCEGLPSDSGPMRRKHFALANGSLHELVGALDLACAIGALAPEPARRAQALAVRVKRACCGRSSPHERGEHGHEPRREPRHLGGAPGARVATERGDLDRRGGLGGLGPRNREGARLVTARDPAGALCAVEASALR